MKILVVQPKPKVGDLSYNFSLIKKYYQQATNLQAEICFFSELVTTGYIPEDLLLNASFIKDLNQHLKDFIATTTATSVLIPTIIEEQNQLFDGVLAIQNGSIIGYTTKKHLPNYRVFDEKRYFVEGIPQIIKINGRKIGVPVCEDFWFPDVSQYLKSMGAEILLVPNGSPYQKEKFNVRLNIAKARFKETSLPVIYCNQVLGQDGIIFDGRSFVYDGKLQYCFKSFAEEAQLFELAGGKVSLLPDASTKLACPPAKIALEDEIYGAMILGLRDYVENNGLQSVIIGLSGGIDSALVATIAVDSLGQENVKTIMMPSIYTSKASIDDARQIASRLGIEHEVIDISTVVDATRNMIKGISGLAAENLQARARGLLLMTLSNMSGSLLLTTGNKSEIAVGYATLYGDMCGGFNPIKDIYKTEVYKILKYRNSNLPQSINVKNPQVNMIPPRVFTKAPSAELKENQKDSDSLPVYEILDQILQQHMENDLGLEEIIQQGFDRSTVEKILKLVKNSEFKRRQSAPGIKLSSRNFEKDRRYPITNGYIPLARE